MSYEILFTDEHRDQVRNRFDETVLDSLEEKLEKKQDELDLVDRRDQAGNRFYNLFGHGGVTIAEARFRAARKKYRGILVLVPRADAFVFYRVVEKEDSYESSKQRKAIGAIEENPGEVKDYARDVVVQEMDY